MTIPSLTLAMPDEPAVDVRQLKASVRGHGVHFLRMRGLTSHDAATGLSQRNALAVLASPESAARVIYDDARATARWCDIARGDVLLVDLRRPSDIRYSGRGELLRADIPMAGLRTFALQHGWREMPDLAISDCGRADTTLACLLASLGPYFDDPHRAGSLVADQVALSVMAHLLSTHTRRTRPATMPKGRLAGWQERRARELIEENLAGDFSVEWLARQCGLSVGYFARAFRETVGVPPYQWMLERRVELAKALMKDRVRSLTDVALSCGFADQSHFSRAFSRVTGVPPGAWRRNEFGHP